jgi:hypothetical protein
MKTQFENNFIELSQWEINDKVSFNADQDQKELGIVSGFCYNVTGELLIQVKAFTGESLKFHPKNKMVNLTNLSR